MGVQVNIKDIFFLTQKSTSPMVITFESQYDKIQVYRNVKKVKDLVNEANESFFFNDYLPSDMSERRRRENEVFRMNEMEEENKIDMVRKGGKLWIESKPYEKKIHTPSPKEMVAVSMTQLDYAMGLELVPGDEVKIEDSTFTAYTRAVNQFDMIQAGYLKMKLLHPTAKHIVCTFRIPGNRPFECEDFCDDNENGAGRVILNWMKDHNIECRVFFIIRHSKAKIGPKRYEGYVEAATMALQQNKVNAITGRNDEVLDHQKMK